jgi:hypothetical protein
LYTVRKIILNSDVDNVGSEPNVAGVEIPTPPFDVRFCAALRIPIWLFNNLVIVWENAYGTVVWHMVAEMGC